MSIYLKPLYQSQLKSKTRQVDRTKQPLVTTSSSIEINMLVIEQESAEQLKQIKETQEILNAFIPLNTPAPYENTNAFKELTRDPIDPISSNGLSQNQRADAEIFVNSFQKNPANLYLTLILILFLIFALFVSGRAGFSSFIDDPFAAIEEAFNPTIQQEKISEVDPSEDQQQSVIRTTQSGELVLDDKHDIVIEKGISPFAVITGKIHNYSNRPHSRIQIEVTLSNLPKNVKNNKLILHAHQISDQQIKDAKESSAQYLNLINLGKSVSEEKLGVGETLEFKVAFEIKPKVKIQSVKLAYSEAEKLK